MSASQRGNKCSLLPRRISAEDINLPPNFPGRLAVCVSSGLSKRTGVNPSRAVAPIFIAPQSALPAPTLHSTALPWSIVSVHHAWSVRESPSNRLSTASLTKSITRPCEFRKSTYTSCGAVMPFTSIFTSAVPQISNGRFVSTKNVLDRTAHLGILRPHTAEQLLVDECVFKLRCRPGLQYGNSHTARHEEGVVRGDAGNSFNLA